ncbi:MAG: InlB B-repeat-containing protein [Ruminococcus sp.]
MKKIKKLSKIKLFSCILIIAVAMSIFTPINVFATTDYGIYVNGEQFTSEKTTINCGDGTATFDISTNTLILNNATITKRYGWQYAVINSEISNLTIQLIGNNVIDGNKGEYDGIDANGGSNVVIVGDGNLTMKDVYYGTYIGDYSVPGGNLKINNTTINIENAQATGIWVNHDLEIINSNIKIDKTGDDVYFGIVSNIGGTITIDGGNLDINTNSHCILLGNGDDSNHNVVIKSGNIKLNSRRDGTYGIKFEPVLNTDTINGNIKIDGGNLEISAIAGGTNIDDSKITIDSKLKFLKGTSLKDNGKILLSEAKNYTVIFNCNGGSPIESQIVQENSTIQQPTAPTKEGYTFAGWYSDSGLTQAFDFNTPISTDITLYAKWNEIINSVSATITLPTANANPVFTGTAGDSTYRVNQRNIYFMDLSTNTNLTAEDTFEAGKTYRIIVWFAPNLGYYIPITATATINGQMASFWTAIADGYGSKGYYIDYTIPAPAVTTYTVTYDANGGTGSMADATVVSGDYVLPVCGFTAPNGKQFKAWSVDGVEKAAGDTITVTSDTIVTAIWEAVKYNVSGSVVSFSDANGDVILQLIPEGYSEAAYETIVIGNNVDYKFSNVATGTYILKVIKENHVTREYTVVVGNSSVIQDVKICLLGDVNMDGAISIPDATEVQKSVAGLVSLTDYQRKLADVNKDGKTSVTDATQIQKFIAGKIDKL